MGTAKKQMKMDFLRLPGGACVVHVALLGFDRYRALQGPLGNHVALMSIHFISISMAKNIRNHPSTILVLP